MNLVNKQPLAELITEHEGNVEHSAYTFTRDSSALIYSTNAYGEFNQAWSYDLMSKDKSENFADNWDVSFTYFSKSGRYQVHGVNADAQTKILKTDLVTNKKMTLPDMPSGDLRGVNFSADGKQMVSI